MKSNYNPYSYSTATDLICGIEVDRKEAESRGQYVDYEGQRYWFCSNSCKSQFELAPELCTLSPAADPEGQLSTEQI